jgi:ribosome-binding factor A
MVKRIERVNEVIREELCKIFLKEIDFPDGVLVTITRVVTSSNIIQAKVFVSVLPDRKTENVFNILNKIIYGIQQKINHRLRMRPIPRIQFEKEEKIKEAARIEQLLEQVKEEPFNESLGE